MIRLFQKDGFSSKVEDRNGKRMVVAKKLFQWSSPKIMQI